MMIESGGDVHAIGDNGNAWGPMQITQGVSDDVNEYYARDFTRDQCFDRFHSKQIFFLYSDIYATEDRIGRKVTLEDRARIWHCGPEGWNNKLDDKAKVKRAKEYWKKVKALL